MKNCNKRHKSQNSQKSKKFSKSKQKKSNTNLQNQNKQNQISYKIINIKQQNSERQKSKKQKEKANKDIFVEELNKKQEQEKKKRSEVKTLIKSPVSRIYIQTIEQSNESPKSQNKEKARINIKESLQNVRATQIDSSDIKLYMNGIKRLQKRLGLKKCTSFSPSSSNTIQQNNFKVNDIEVKSDLSMSMSSHINQLKSKNRVYQKMALAKYDKKLQSQFFTPTMNYQNQDISQDADLNISYFNNNQTNQNFSIDSNKHLKNNDNNYLKNKNEALFMDKQSNISDQQSLILKYAEILSAQKSPIQNYNKPSFNQIQNQVWSEQNNQEINFQQRNNSVAESQVNQSVRTSQMFNEHAWNRMTDKIEGILKDKKIL